MEIITFIILAVVLVALFEGFGLFIAALLFLFSWDVLKDAIEVGEPLELSVNQQYCLDNFEVTKVRKVKKFDELFVYYCVVGDKLKLIDDGGYNDADFN